MASQDVKMIKEFSTFVGRLSEKIRFGVLLPMPWMYDV